MIKILFLAANPLDTDRLRLDEEVRAIDEALRKADFSAHFDLRSHWAVRIEDLQELLLRYKPDIVHFSGHGKGTRDTGQSASPLIDQTDADRHLLPVSEEGEDGHRPASQIVLQNASGTSAPVPPSALSNLFRVLKDNIRCVVLNACYTQAQAEGIAQHIDCVIGMSDAIPDVTAIAFAAAFYRGLGYGRSLQLAFDLGCSQIDLSVLRGSALPQLIAFRTGADQLVLVADGVLPPPQRGTKLGRVWQWGVGVVILLLMTMGVFNYWGNIGPLLGFSVGSTPPPTAMATGSRATETPSGAVAIAPSSTSISTATDTPRPTATPTAMPTSSEPPPPPSATATNASALPTPTPVPLATPTATPIPTLPPPTDPVEPTTTPAQTAQPTPMAGTTLVVDDIVYVYVPAGEFLMGSSDEDELATSDEKPQHSVYVDEFWIMQTEVTNAYYRRCVDAHVCTIPNNDRWSDVPYAEYPVTNVTWQQANSYAEWMRGRLPTEAEWEMACRGTDNRIYAWGNENPDETRLNYTGNVGSTTEVGSYPPGAYGLYDMAGNVWEWTTDWYDPNYYTNSPEHNPTGPAKNTDRTLRGGSWGNIGSNVRCADRYRAGPNYNLDTLGFRVVVSSPDF